MDAATQFSETDRAQTLERNLHALTVTSPRTAAAIRAATPRDDVSFQPAPDGALTATIGRAPDLRHLASRRAPLDEARQLAETVDVGQAAGIVVLGLGIGHHVRALAAKLGRTGVIICFEPDLGLLRSVFDHIDLVPMMKATNFVLLTNPDDLAEISASIRGVEGILAVGVRIVAHPPSKPRLGTAADRFSDLFTKVMRSVRTTVVTTLVQSEVTLRNLLMNLETYATAGSVGELKDSCRGRPAIVVSAGPSLRRNLDLLGRPGVRERFVIIAVQTVLKQMLARGIRPHFVTALDYHEISRRFYEGLTAEDVAGVTLVAEPKANPAILEAFPGTIRCPADTFLDTLLGPGLKRDMGELTQGATVAHLAYYLARHLGCDPVILIGQDLGFTDGQYYPAGAAIHQVWSGELNPFRTLEMFEWERIVRNRRYLMKATDVLGRPIYTDEQMSTYLVQFERDFLADTQRGLTVIDATEGGVAKNAAPTMPLAQALNAHRHGPHVALPAGDAPAMPRASRLRKVTDRVKAIRGEVWQVSECSRKAHDLLSRMLELTDQARINALIVELNKVNAKVRGHTSAFTLVEFLNQTGALNRFKADRALELAKTSTKLEEQAQRIQRDRTNVKWIGDAADQLGTMLESALACLGGAPKITRDPPPSASAADSDAALAPLQRGEVAGGPSAGKPTVGEGCLVARSPGGRTPRVAAVIHVDPHRSGLGTLRALSEPFLLGENPLRLTLARLARCKRLAGVVILSGDPEHTRRLVGQAPEALRIDFIRSENDSHRSAAIGAGRLWSGASWRGGLGGLTCYDELCNPGTAAAALKDLDLDAAVLVGADWALVDPALVDAVIERYLERPSKYRVTFTQAPPGLAGCLVDRGILGEIAAQTQTAGVFASIAGLLGYVPVAPQLDPIGKAVCVNIAPSVRDLGIRCIPDSAPRRKLLADALSPLGLRATEAGAEELAALIGSRALGQPAALPQQVTIELCTGRLTSGRRSEWWRGFGEMIERPSMTQALAERILGPLCAARTDLAITLAGAGDPLLHPDLPRIVALAHACGAGAVHVRTDLVAQPGTIDALLEAAPDIISVDLMATDPDAYRRLMGIDRLVHVRDNLDALTKRCAQTRTGSLRLPWIVPRLTRCDTVYEQVERFYDHALMQTGAAVIDPLPQPMPGERIEPLPPPADAARRHDLETLTILSDGSVPINPDDLRCEHPIANAARDAIPDLWRRVVAARKDRWHHRTGAGPRRAAG
jgi:hypothetical protein